MAVGVFDTVIFQNDIYQGPHAVEQLIFGTSVSIASQNKETTKRAGETSATSRSISTKTQIINAVSED